MTKGALIAAALAALLIPTTAGAKDKVDPRIDKMLSCAAQTSADERLRCYDQAVAGLKSALEAGQLVAHEEKNPKALEGVIRAAGPMGFNRYWAELSTGDRWEIISTSMRDEAPRPGDKVKLRKGFMGNYWFSDPRSPDRRARFLGRRD